MICALFIRRTKSDSCHLYKTWQVEEGPRERETEKREERDGEDAHDVFCLLDKGLVELTFCMTKSKGERHCIVDLLVVWISTRLFYVTKYIDGRFSFRVFKPIVSIKRYFSGKIFQNVVQSVTLHARRRNPGAFFLLVFHIARAAYNSLAISAKY